MQFVCRPMRYFEKTYDRQYYFKKTNTQIKLIIPKPSEHLNMNKLRLLFLSFAFASAMTCAAQGKTSPWSVGLGCGMLYYPDGHLVGMSHDGSLDYRFAQHFGACVSFASAYASHDDNYSFDHSRSSLCSLGMFYLPMENNESLSIEMAFAVQLNNRIRGSKDEPITSNYALSGFTSYEKDLKYGLNVGIQIPLFVKKQFALAARMDAWSSWLKLDTVGFKLFAIYYL